MDVGSDYAVHQEIAACIIAGTAFFPSLVATEWTIIVALAHVVKPPGGSESCPMHGRKLLVPKEASRNTNCKSAQVKIRVTYVVSRVMASAQLHKVTSSDVTRYCNTIRVRYLETPVTRGSQH
ncbi:hypothetical protein BKA64DRAFT_702906 [Cadophora sp. MPI-SDFR-AT-0126]|nr:hypothetical protein BKA64DRAFT_702906 [Leotiomycetes sp. MPI-SDFR-AT-0126]